MFALLLSILPGLALVADDVDRLEVNTVVDPCGRVRLTQSLWLGAGEHVRSWRWHDRDHLPTAGHSLFYDRGVLRGVRVRSVGYSRTPADVEVLNRNVVPLVWRQGLGGEE